MCLRIHHCGIGGKIAPFGLVCIRKCQAYIKDWRSLDSFPLRLFQIRSIHCLEVAITSLCGAQDDGVPVLPHRMQTCAVGHNPLRGNLGADTLKNEGTSTSTRATRCQSVGSQGKVANQRHEMFEIPCVQGHFQARMHRRNETIERADMMAKSIAG